MDILVIGVIAAVLLALITLIVGNFLNNYLQETEAPVVQDSVAHLRSFFNE